MTKEQVINEVANNKLYLNACKRVAGGNGKDVLQDLLVTLLEKSPEEFESLNPITPYIIKIINNMVYSKSNHYEFTYRRKVDDKDYKNYLLTEASYNKNVDTLANRASKIIDSLYWYDKEIFKLYLEINNKEEISRQTKINRKSIERTVNKVKGEIKLRLKMPIKVLLLVQYKVTAVQHYRQLIPHERLLKLFPSDYEIHQKIGNVVKNEKGEDIILEPTIQDLTDEQLKEYSIVCYLRQISYTKENIDTSVERLHSLGIKVILDIDDYWELPKEHHLYIPYTQNNVSQTTTYTLSKVDYVSTTTEYFADKIEKYNENVVVLPNSISPDDKQFTPRKIESSRVRFGWIGGVYHKHDIKIMCKGIKKIYESKELNNKWQICLGGYNPNPEYNEIEMMLSNFYDFRYSDPIYFEYLMQYTPMMEHIGYDKTYRRMWGRPVTQYADMYNEIDIALIPLKENEFNKCKSELKIIEAGYMSKAVIVSDTTPYREFIIHGKNGLLVKPSRNNIDWYVNMRKLILNPSMIEDLGGALKETIKANFDIDDITKERAELYKSLI